MKDYRNSPLTSSTLGIIVSSSVALAVKNAQIERKIASCWYTILQFATIWR